jgi:aldehyde:ferredoxin oxidoreductase
MTSFAGGWMGRLLHADLSAGTVRSLDLPRDLAEQWVGGKGFAARLLYDLIPAGADPLGPDNALLFLPGPLTGSRAPAMRACVATKSPATGLFLDSYFGGSFGAEIKYAGFDGLIVTGRSPEPCVLAVLDDEPSVLAAPDLWGLDALDANAELKDWLGDVRAVTIGPAGENLTRYALISCEYNRQAGRGGAGAVMGSKNLKAVALRGMHAVRPADPRAMERAVGAANEELPRSPEVRALMAYGTGDAVNFTNETGLLPHRNYATGTYAATEKLNEQAQQQHIWLTTGACLGCPIACAKAGAVRLGKYKGTVTDIVEYESVAMLGANLEIKDIRAVAHLVHLCDRLGLDSISAGGVVGFAMEASERGLIEEELPFGSVDAAERVIRAVAHREGPLGELLADGVAEAARRLGPEAEEFAVHVKGLEAPAWGPRGAPAMGLALMTSDRGACHQRGLPAPLEVSGQDEEGNPLETLGLEGKAALLKGLQDHSAATDVLVKCDFGTFGIGDETYAAMLSAMTGLDMDAKALTALGERIWTQTRLFNLREGLDPAMDRLPKRFAAEALPDGPYAGHRISPEDQQKLLADYYALRGWDPEGRPTRATVRAHGLDAGPAAHGGLDL